MKIPGAHWLISLVPESPVSIVSQGDARKKTWWTISLGDYERICYKSNSELTDASKGIIKKKSHKNTIT